MRQLGLDGGKQNTLFVAAWVGQHSRVLFGLLAQVHQQGGITAIVKNHVGAFALGTLGAEVENTVGVVPIIFQRLAFDSKHGGAVGGNGRGRMVLGREDVARCPAHVGAQGLQRLDQHGGLDGHVQRAGDASPFQGLLGRELFADSHEARHLGFGNFDFLATPGSKGQVGDQIVGRGDRFEYSVHGSAPVS